MKGLVLFVEVCAFIFVPITMVIGYYFFGYAAWRNLRLFTDLPSDYFAGLIAACFFLFIIQLLPVQKNYKYALSILWIIRCGITLGFAFYFESAHHFDAMRYFAWGAFDAYEFGFESFGDGNNFVMLISGFLSDIFVSFRMNTVVFSFFGLLAVFFHYLAFRLFVGRDMIPMLYLIGIFPSVLFWSSMLGKDGITLLGIGVYVYGVVGLYKEGKLRYAAFVILGLLIAMMIRVWLGVIFLMPLIASYVLTSRASLLTKMGFGALAVPVFLFALQSFAERFQIETAADLVQTSDHLSKAWAVGDAAQEVQSFGSIGEMVAFMPIGIFTALFRPLPGEVLNPLGMIAGIENLVLLGLFVLGIQKRGFGWLKTPILLWAVFLLLAWGTVYGFVSYQNLGTAFRFRIQVALILFLLGLYLYMGDRLTKRRWQVDERSEAGESAGDQAKVPAE